MLKLNKKTRLFFSSFLSPNFFFNLRINNIFSKIFSRSCSYISILSANKVNSDLSTNSSSKIYNILQKDMLRINYNINQSIKKISNAKK